jgi:hypothetical protein
MAGEIGIEQFGRSSVAQTYEKNGGDRFLMSSLLAISEIFSVDRSSLSVTLALS